QACREPLELPASAPVVGLMPGSRAHEMKHMGPVFLDAAALLAERNPAIRFVLPLADPRFHAPLTRDLEARRLDPMVRLTEDSRTAMRASDALLVTSEAAALLPGGGTLLRVARTVVAFGRGSPAADAPAQATNGSLDERNERPDLGRGRQLPQPEQRVADPEP